MKQLRVSAVLFAILAAGCERATAPQVRDSIEVAQRRLLDGNLDRIDGRISVLIDRVRAKYSDVGRFPSSRIVVERGGSRHLMTATVFERVYLPPPGSGGLPFIRRSVLASDDSTTRGVVLLADDAQSAVKLPTHDALDESSSQRLFRHLGFAFEIEPGEQRAWFGRDGQVEIGDGTPVGDCPFANHPEHRGDYFNLSNGPLPAGVTCQTAEYLVSVRTTLATDDPDEQSAIGSWAGPHPSLISDPQLVRGVRIVTPCGKFDPQAPDQCPSVFSFWRQSSQFVPQLGVDLSTFHREQFTFWKLTSPGTGSFRATPIKHPVRYTVFAADGRALRQVTLDDLDSTLMKIGLWDIPELRPGARGQIVGSAGFLEIPNEAPATLAVVNFEMLRPPNPW